MRPGIDRLIDEGCSSPAKDKICRSRGGESCAFDGAMIVLQPIADTAHIVHGPIACCGNSWEGRGTLSRQGDLHRRGFTTDMSELDIIYGADTKLASAIRDTARRVNPRAVFVYSTCVSGLIGEDIEAVCREAEAELGLRVIPVNAAGFVGPKNLGNRIAGEVLLERVIGTGGPAPAQRIGINLIGEYNIAGDLWNVEKVLDRAGISVNARLTGDSTFEEITRAHHAALNVVVCSRALINVARGMQEKYGIPFVEVSFFGKTEMSKALWLIGETLPPAGDSAEFLHSRLSAVIAEEERMVEARLESYRHLRGKRVVLYTGGVKSWSFISALTDLGMEIVAVGTKKSTAEDEEKMRLILGPDAPLVEDVAPGYLKKLLKERRADVLVAGGRNQYLAIKEGYPFIDVNQERHSAYAGYEGLITIAEEIRNSMRFYDSLRSPAFGAASQGDAVAQPSQRCVIDPLKHSPAIGAAMAVQGIDRALPLIHGAQGCTFLGKVLLTKHFREPISLAGSKLFAEEVVMGSDAALEKTVRGFIEKNAPDLIAVLTSGLVEVKGDDVAGLVKSLAEDAGLGTLLHASTPDYEGGLETGYAKAVCAVLAALVRERGSRNAVTGAPNRVVNILAGPHLTPADFMELRELGEAFGLQPLILPDLGCLDGSRQGISPLASGGITREEIRMMGGAVFTLVIGRSLAPAARIMEERCGIQYRVFDSIAGLKDVDWFFETLAMLGSRGMPERIARQRRVLEDGMRDCHAVFGGKKICLALDPDHAAQTSHWVTEMAADIPFALLPHRSDAEDAVRAEEVSTGGLAALEGTFDLLISNSHAEDTAQRLGVPLLQAGFPVWKVYGYPQRVTIGYRGTLSLIQEAATLLAHKEVHG